MRKSLLTLALLLVGLCAAAQEPARDLGTWTSLQLGHSWSSGWYANLRGEHRTIQHNTLFADGELDRSLGLDLCFLRATVGRKVLPWLKVDLGSDIFHTRSSTKYRLLLSATATLRQGNLSASFRQRYILSYLPDTDKPWGHLLRTYLRVNYAIPNSRFTPYLAFELYTWDRWKQSHHFAGTKLRINKSNTLDLFYGYILKAGWADEGHILGIGYELAI